jgi:chaperonin cofactor prefoldin
MGIDAAKSESLHNAHDGLRSRILSFRQEGQEETDLILFLNQMLAQRSGIDKKLANAISAMMELSLLFRNQSDCYDKISQFLERTEPSTDLEALKSRKMFIQYQVDTCANKLREVSKCRGYELGAFPESLYPPFFPKVLE